MKTDIFANIATLTRPLRARLSNVDRVELGQAYLRVVIAAMIVVYGLWYTSGVRHPTINAGLLLSVCAYFAAALAIVLAVWVWPGPSVLRRVVGIAVDVIMATWGLWPLGEGGVVIVGLYLFVIMGNGFRYGRAYLHVAQSLSIAGLAFALAKAPWWEEHLVIGLGLLEILLIIPFYVGMLAERLRHALVNAQRALEECRHDRGGGGSTQSSEASGG